MLHLFPVLQHLYLILIYIFWVMAKLILWCEREITSKWVISAQCMWMYVIMRTDILFHWLHKTWKKPWWRDGLNMYLNTLMTFVVQFYIEGHIMELSSSPSLSLLPYFLLGSLIFPFFLLLLAWEKRIIAWVFRSSLIACIELHTL